MGKFPKILLSIGLTFVVSLALRRMVVVSLLFFLVATKTTRMMVIPSSTLDQVAEIFLATRGLLSNPWTKN